MSSSLGDVNIQTICVWFGHDVAVTVAVGDRRKTEDQKLSYVVFESMIFLFYQSGKLAWLSVVLVNTAWKATVL